VPKFHAGHGGWAACRRRGFGFAPGADEPWTRWVNVLHASLKRQTVYSEKAEPALVLRENFP
jgi:hypothetical protein